MNYIFVSEDEHAKSIGAKRKFHWRERKIYKDGKPVVRRVAVVWRRPIWEVSTYWRREQHQGFVPWQYLYWWLTPKLYNEKWILECGHIILPQRNIGSSMFDKDAYLKPDDYEHWCTSCRNETAEVTVERYKDYYWDYHTAENPHKSISCNECGACSICQDHVGKCKQPWREWLLEIIWDEIGLVNYSDEEFQREREKVHDTIQSLLQVMNKEALKEVTSWYNEE